MASFGGGIVISGDKYTFVERVTKALTVLFGDGRREDRPAESLIVQATPGPVFGTLTMPNGQIIKTMREDAFQAALIASGNK